MIVTGLADAEKWITVAAIPVTILILFMAGFWTRRENSFGMIVTILCYLGGLAYFIFKLARMYSPAKRDNYLPVRKNLTSFAVITILLLLLTITNACACMANFNKGLKPHILKRKMGTEVEKRENMTEMPDLNHGGQPTSNRMTID